MRYVDKLKALFFDPSFLSAPPGTALGPTDVTITGRGCVEIVGCKGIEAYEETRISLRVKEGVLSVCGEGLSLKTYRQNRIAVCGRIDLVRFDR